VRCRQESASCGPNRCLVRTFRLLMEFLQPILKKSPQLTSIKRKCAPRRESGPLQTAGPPACEQKVRWHGMK
jgi:hypothetical protein